MKIKFFLIILIILSASVLAEVEITKEPVTEVVVKEINNPAIFNFTLKNLGSTDNFEIYSLVGVDFSPRGTFQIRGGEAKKLEVEVYPDEKAREKSGYFKFEYKIRGQESGIQTDELMIKILPLQNVLSLTAKYISIGDSQATIKIKNLEKNNFPELRAKFSSAFFEYQEIFSLSALEEKEINVSINKNTLKLLAGEYILTAEVEIQGKEAKVEGKMNYAEEPDILTNKEESGFIVRTEEIEKVNKGNLPITTQVSMKKNIISRIFSSFSPIPDSSERKGFFVYYIWQKEISPGESFKATLTTNWLYPLLIVFVIVVLIFLLKLNLTKDLSIEKKASFVRTKGGEFALKVALTLRARKYVENVRIEDKLPPLVKIYERFGANPPDKIDEKNKRLEWNFPSFQAGEMRSLYYIIYSKVGVIGRFILPQAAAIYEVKGKVKEVSSNKAFFVTEQKGSSEE